MCFVPQTVPHANPGNWCHLLSTRLKAWPSPLLLPVVGKRTPAVSAQPLQKTSWRPSLEINRKGPCEEDT
jgi:hypothetical protein